MPTARPPVIWKSSIRFRDLEGKVLIKWQTSNYTYSLIDQPLPLKQTVNIKDAKG